MRLLIKNNDTKEKLENSQFKWDTYRKKCLISLYRGVF
jgi:hypothetical protein